MNTVEAAVGAVVDGFSGAFAGVQGWLHEHCVQPMLFALGWMRFSEQAYDAIEWLLVGVLEVLMLALILAPLERRFPAEALTDRRAVRIDRIYTLLARLGAVPLIAFALLTPGMDWLEGQLRLLGVTRLNLDQVWPGVTDVAWVGFLLYLVVLDLVDYGIHRGQHAWRWWWALHALHHSQRQMTFWSDDRNHLLDDLLRDAVMAAVALAIGVAPAQFLLLVLASRVLQSLQHANLRWRWGRWGEYLLVSPSFHRRHHAIGYGHEGPASGCNFAVLLPIWDVLFGTADFRPGFVPTGVSDQLAGRDYGQGWWSHQRLGVIRLLQAFRPPQPAANAPIARPSCDE